MKHSEKKYKLSPNEPIRFHTPYLRLEEGQGFWVVSPENASRLEARVNLTFNYPVSPGQLAGLLKVKAGDTDVPAELVTASRDQVLTVALKGFDPIGEQEHPVRVAVGKGLSTEGSAYVTPADLTQEIIIPSRGRMQVTEVSALLEDGQERVYVFTTQPVDSKNLKSLLTLQPKVDFSADLLDNGFLLTGNFNPAETYQLTVSGKLKGLVGQEMGTPYRHPVSFGSTEPTISFASAKGIYLSSAGNRNLPLTIMNVPRVKVTVGKVFESNIQGFLRDGQVYEDYYDEATDEYNSSMTYQVGENNGNLIFEREYDTKSLPKAGKNQLLHLNLDDLDFDSQYKGLYVVTVSSTEQKWLKASKIVAVSDIGLIARQGEDEVVVFANSIKDATVLPGTEIRFISTNNQVMHQATTDRDGVARFSDISAQSPGFKVGMVTARLGQDFTYLPLQQTAVKTSRFEVGGKRLKGLNYDAFIYGDRDLYRPGDTLHVNVLVRTPDWETVAGIPLKLKLLLPNGREYKSVKKTLNEQGAAETAFTLSSSAVTGTYTLEEYSGNDVLLNAKKISVEEFMPHRIKVEATLNKTAFVPGEELAAKLKALNLFGPPAAFRNYEVQLSLKKKPFEARNFPQYLFDIKTSATLDLQKNVRQGQTNEQGEGAETFTLTDYTDIGLLDGTVYATVFDETGRPVHRLAKFELSTQKAFFGIGRQDAYVSTRRPLTVPVIALDRTGKALTGATARVQVIRYTYESVLERNGNRYRYNSQQKENILLTKELTVPAQGASFTFTPIHSGSYEVRVMRPGSSTYVAQPFYAYGHGDTESTSFEVNNEGEVDISFDKESYEIGEQASILFKSPFAGKILVTVERDRLLSYHYLDTDKKAASLTLPIEGAFLPTVYVTATAIREIKDNSLPLTVARGFAPLEVTKRSTRLPVTITAPATSRSHRMQQIQVQTAPNTEVTVAVVDEGILQLKDYQTPDPHGFFYQKRALETQAFDLYPYLFPEISSRSSRVGGDGYDLNRRVNPFTSKRVRLVAVWSGPLKTNSRGEASVAVRIPEFSGALRVMAVAYNGEAFGSADTFIKVADPVVISAALPRFASPRDTLLLPVTLTNTTGTKTTATSTLKVSGPLRVVGEAKQSAALGANAETQVLYRLVAEPTIGEATVTVTVGALGETFRSETDLAVRPASPLLKVTEAGSLAGGASKQLQLTQPFISASLRTRLVLSQSPLAQFTDDLTYLLQYPHGCLEQTTSIVFPLLYYSDLARSLAQQKEERTYNPAFLVQEAITKIESLQQYDGGLVYWPGAEVTDWWSSAYAAHFLLEARKAGYPVNEQVLAKLMTYLQRRVKEKTTEPYTYYDTGGKLNQTFIASKEIAYSLYVLALAQKPEWSTMNYLKAKPELLAMDGKYLLASTYGLSGQRAVFSQMLPNSFGGERSVQALSGSFYSALRDRALALNALLEADPDHPQVGTLAKHLSEELRSGKWHNTQERAFSLLALGKLARRGNSSNLTAKVLVGEKEIAASAGGKDLVLTNRLNAGTATVRTSGQGTLYYFWEIEGISPTGAYPQEDQYLKVRRTYFDRDGKEISGQNIRQNDLVVVRLTLEAQEGHKVPNVAVTELLPAGFEIENPRLGSEREIPWVKNIAVPDHADIRDDRILLYTTATAQPQHFYYQVRAVSKGTFQVEPVSADAMYNAEYHSYHGAGVVRVR